MAKKKQPAKRTAASRPAKPSAKKEGSTPKRIDTTSFLVDRNTLSTLMGAHGIDRKGLENITGVDYSTLGKMERGLPVTEAFAKRVADYFGIPLAEFGEHLAVRRSSPELYHAFGLSDQLNPVSDEWEYFQNFDPDDPRRPEHLPPINNSIDFFWADGMVEGSSIKAHVKQDEQEGHRYLRIEFDLPGKSTEGASFPCNVAIHPQCLTAVRVDLHVYPYLVIPCRLPSVESNEKGSQPIQMSLRVRDAKMRQWVYGTADSTHIKSLHTLPRWRPEDAQWKVVVAPLNQNRWNAFEKTSTTSYERRDFSTVTSVIIELGRGRAGMRPGPGTGVVDIGPIMFARTAPSS